MLLSMQMFDRIAGLSQGVARDNTVLPVGCRRAPERRQASRIAYGYRTQICRDSGPKAGVWDTVMLRDISVSGVGYLCHEPMNRGDTFVLKLLDKEGQTIRIRCSVSRCEAGGFGNAAFLLGACFEQVVQQILRVNEDENATQLPAEIIKTDAAPVKQPIGHRLSKIAAAAMGFLRAVDPVRLTAQLMHRADDFSSMN